MGNSSTSSGVWSVAILDVVYESIEKELDAPYPIGRRYESKVYASHTLEHALQEVITKLAESKLSRSVDRKRCHRLWFGVYREDYTSIESSVSFSELKRLRELLPHLRVEVCYMPKISMSLDLTQKADEE